MAARLIRRADQAVIALLTAILLAGAAAWWVRAGGLRGELVDIDRAAPLGYEFLVDVNRADWPELAQLPGIGPVLAKRIVATRSREGGYRTPDDLRRVPGIGPRKLEAIRRHLLPLPDDTQVAEEEWGADRRGSSG
ncbi:helix-hairpin-helix domain-containing protein [Botrimarina sp.]|uniref:ComEA family DNA-binding protein n=1 Tax=Botrimarina sp. TaxID=2795802 RepID=UPI0032EECC05